MKKTLAAVVAFAAVSIASVSVVWAITEDQAKVIPVLETLQLEPVKSKVIGGPQKFKVTKKTLDLLKKAMDDGHVIILDNDGTIKIEKDK
jgi:hypothetical protein